MALQRSIHRRSMKEIENENEDEDEDHHHHEIDEEIDETEDDLIENYRFLTQRCGVFKQSPTFDVITRTPQQQPPPPPNLLRHYSSVSERPTNSNHTKTIDYERSLPSSKQRYLPSNDLNNNPSPHTRATAMTTTTSRVPPTIYYDDTEDDAYAHNHSFSLVKLFTRMKTRFKHDKRYRPKQSHELLCEADPQEWLELTKNVRTVLTKALLPDGGYDALIQRSKTHRHHRKSSFRKSREYDPVLSRENDDDEKIDLEVDDELNTEGDESFDEIIWQNFLTSPRGSQYRRCGVCKAVDRQQFQGQLVYFYGVANNILIDENLKASGLG